LQEWHQEGGKGDSDAVERFSAAFLMPRIIYIHGRGLKPPATVERKAWLDALNRGLQRLGPTLHQLPDTDAIRLAYWSDVFYPPGASEQSGGLSADQTTAIFALVNKFWEWRLPQSVAAPPAVAPEVKQFEDNFVRDTIKFFGLGFGDRCSNPLRDQLRDVPNGEPVMLVAHSFGTVISYQVLVQDLESVDADRLAAGRDPLHIDTWVTMGAPLSWVVDLQDRVPTWQEQLIAEVDQGLQPFLGAARRTLETIGNLLRRPAVAAGVPGLMGTSLFHVAAKQFPPRGVDRWFNIYDPRDPVACAAGFGTLLTGLAVGETFLFGDQQRAFDITIRNDACPAGVTVADLRAHMDYTGYGQCAQLAQLISDFWTRSSGAWS
jgi:hypothetical protein